MCPSLLPRVLIVLHCWGSGHCTVSSLFPLLFFPLFRLVPGFPQRWFFHMQVVVLAVAGVCFIAPGFSVPAVVVHRRALLGVSSAVCASPVPLSLLFIAFIVFSFHVLLLSVLPMSFIVLSFRDVLACGVVVVVVALRRLFFRRGCEAVPLLRVPVCSVLRGCVVFAMTRRPSFASRHSGRVSPVGTSTSGQLGVRSGRACGRRGGHGRRHVPTSPDGCRGVYVREGYVLSWLCLPSGMVCVVRLSSYFVVSPSVCLPHMLCVIARKYCSTNAPQARFPARRCPFITVRYLHCPLRLGHDVDRAPLWAVVVS